VSTVRHSYHSILTVECDILKKCRKRKNTTSSKFKRKRSFSFHGVFFSTPEEEEKEDDHEIEH
jgi:hypothetical protein